MYDELKTLIVQGNETISNRFEELEQRIADTETKAARPRATAGSTKGLSIEAKALATFFESGEGLSRKAISGATGAAGGFALPEEINQVVQDQLIDVSPIRSIARIVQVQTPDYKLLIGARGTTTAWNAEATDRSTETNTPTLVEVAPTFGELWAYPSISQFALDDLVFDPEGWLQLNVTDAFAQAEGAAFVAGNGTNRPTGFLTGTPVATGDASRAAGVLQFLPTGTSGTLGSAPADLLVTMVYTLKAGYRANARWVMNSATAGTVRKFKDSEGRFLWADSLAAGQPPLLLGYEVVIAEDMPDIAANSFPIAFGDFGRGYLIADRTGLRIIRDEVTKPGWVRYLIGKRVGGAIADSNAIKLIKCSAT
jgi:HK97 family phage major capsid protein